MSLDGIAKEDLWLAVHDLRNAALVVEHAGHTKGAMVAPTTGAVCAGGAIEAATYRPLGFMPTLRLYTLNVAGAPTFRAKNAYTVFADFLPKGLCEKCEWLDDDERTAEYAVVHYNDFHCPGGKVLINMLNLAADEAVNVIADQRKLLTGPRVLVNA